MTNVSVSKSWCFTLNNYDETELVALRTSLSNKDKVRYAVFGKEVGEGGTPHLQGYVSFKTAMRFGGVKQMVSERAHVEACKASEAENFAYCTKSDKNFEEFGARDGRRGKRTDLEGFKEAVKGGEFDWNVLVENYSEVTARYETWCRNYLAIHRPLPPIPTYPLNSWQQELNSKLKGPPDDRTVIFIVDYKGKKGKSWFAKYYCRLHDDAVIMRPTKNADMAYALPANLRVFFLDCTRQQVEHLPYAFIEQIKDGVVFSNKYRSTVKQYGPVHVVVMMNTDPDMNVLSEDRYDIMRL